MEHTKKADYTSMNTIIVDKKKLLNKLKQNMILHKKAYDESCDAYKIILKHKLQEKIDALDEGKTPDPFVSDVSKPVNYLESYNTAISMLEFSIHSKVAITRSEFENVVMDNWSWKESFTNLYNSNITGSMMYRESK